MQSSDRALLVLGLLVACLAPGHAGAASFDCARAQSPREKLICGAPELSALDGQLGAVYAAELGALSATGAQLQRDAQRSWLKYLGIICPLAKTSSADDRKQAVACLVGAYRDRVKQLSRAVTTIGPFVFNRIDLYQARAAEADDDSGAPPGFGTIHVAFPQIDAPATPQAQAWNTRMRRSIGAGDCDGEGDDDFDYELTLATPRLIAMRWTDYHYCRGTPHGFFNSKVENLWLSPALRPLEPGDLFNVSRDWKVQLPRLVLDALHAAGWSPDPDLQAEVDHSIGTVVVRPEKWGLTPEGLSFEFDAYEVGCYACTPPTVTVPWLKLKPLLAATAPVP
jgi:uncharacterized protein